MGQAYYRTNLIKMQGIFNDLPKRQPGKFVTRFFHNRSNDNILQIIFLIINVHCRKSFINPRDPQQAIELEVSFYLSLSISMQLYMLITFSIFFNVYDLTPLWFEFKCHWLQFRQGMHDLWESVGGSIQK